jgi:CubicO group peptidase (beta-lactamase class C family)
MTNMRYVSVVLPAVLTVLWLGTAATIAATTAATTAKENTVPQARLEAAAAAVATEVVNGKLSGAVTLVAQHGKVRLLEAVGHQDLEQGVPMATDTIFRIFSMTKPVTGTALMILFDKGKFQLSDPVEKYIPEFAGLRVAVADGPEGQPVTEAANHKMTIRELMSHTGGLTYGYFSQSQVDSLYNKANLLDRNSSLRQMVEKLAQIPLWAQPGTQWQYSVAVDVQGYLVEILSGQSFDSFLRERLFVPLAMVDTGFYVPPEKAVRLARYYGPGADGLLVSAANAEYLVRPTLFSGGGGLVSTAADFLRFAQMHLNGGELDGVRILSEDAITLMRSNQLPRGVEIKSLMVDPGNVFGLDFAVVNDPVKAFGQPVGNYWWWGIAGTWFWIDPVNDLIFIGMIQTRDVRQSVILHRTSKYLVYGD